MFPLQAEATQTCDEWTPGNVLSENESRTALVKWRGTWYVEGSPGFPVLWLLASAVGLKKLWRA